ncbi:hypothetical protein VINE108274_06540 [Vibrio neptunius]
MEEEPTLSGWLFYEIKMKAIFHWCDMMRENFQLHSKNEVSWTAQI